MLTIFELVLNDHIGGELANVNALHICLVIIMIIMIIITYILKASIGTPTIPQKNLNFP